MKIDWVEHELRRNRSQELKDVPVEVEFFVCCCLLIVRFFLRSANLFECNCSQRLHIGAHCVPWLVFVNSLLPQTENSGQGFCGGSWGPVLPILLKTGNGTSSVHVYLSIPRVD